MASRLIDKLIADRELPEDLTSSVAPMGLRAALTTSQVIDVDNVYEYLLTNVVPKVRRDGKIFIREIKFLPVAPAFERTFMEYNLTVIPHKFGVLCFRMPSERDDFKWFISCAVFCPRGDNFDPYIGRIAFRVDKDGQLDHERPYAIDLASHQEESVRNGIETALHAAALTTVFTFAFMNCKNAILDAIEPNAQENKRRLKHGKLPLMRYHVLKIKPFGGRSDAEGQGGTHASPALHIRRGHFKTYTDSAPLFGKYVGTYWVDQHIAGRKSDRVVVKDYEVDLTVTERDTMSGQNAVIPCYNDK